MRIQSLLFAAALLALPTAAAAQTQARGPSVLQPGEFSVGAEILPADVINAQFLAATSDNGATPSTGFNLRYAFDNRLALIGTLGFSLVTVADKQDDPPARYSVGVGGQFNLIQSGSTAFFFRGGLQFIPRDDDGPDDQELGVRLWAGPGVEARVADPLSIAFYTSMLDLQLGGDTRFDLEIVPTVGMWLYF